MSRESLEDGRQLDLVRSLISRGEGEHLDYKRDYSFADRNELAKDIMALCNALSPGQAPAYILVGVEELDDRTGRIVGVDPGAHEDDASLQEAVKSRLVRPPSFSYFPVEVDGLSVGVLEVRPGGRPVFPSRDKGTLKRNVPLVRRGTATDIASPDEVIDWAREDDPERQRIATLELQAREADARPNVAFDYRSRKRSPKLNSGSLTLENVGPRAAEIVEIRARLLIRSGLTRGAEVWRGQMARPRPATLAPGSTTTVRVVLGADVHEALAAKGVKKWAEVEVEIEIESRSDVGGENTQSHRFRAT